VYAAAPALLAQADPALGRVLAARARREEARRLFGQDPSLARELGIGRPDLGREYDDGGLVDINTASADVIAGVSGIEPKYAEALVAARGGGGWFNLGEVLVDLDLPPHVQEQLREHAVV
jgi:DNA uptake protein ComE-like DNA-binding protein